MDTSATYPFKKPTERLPAQYHIIYEAVGKFRFENGSGSNSDFSQAEDGEVEKMPDEIRKRKWKAYDLVDMPIEKRTKVGLVEKGFNDWSDRKTNIEERYQETQLQLPTPPDGIKSISLPIETLENTDTTNQYLGECFIVVDPVWKSDVNTLYDYTQRHALTLRPNFIFTEVKIGPTAVHYATIKISNIKYCTGSGTTKKKAKHSASKLALAVLISETESKITADTQSGCTRLDEDEDLLFFDEVSVEDTRVSEFCAKTTEPTPYDVLRTCLTRNFVLDDLKTHYQLNTSKHQGNEFLMTLGKHTAKVNCKDEQEGKQRASQAILQKLHPSITSWGSLLRLYGNRPVEFEQAEIIVTRNHSLKNRAAVDNHPSYADAIDKLKRREIFSSIVVLDTSTHSAK